LRNRKLTKPGWNHLEQRTMRGVLGAWANLPDRQEWKMIVNPRPGLTECASAHSRWPKGAPSQLSGHSGEALLAPRSSAVVRFRTRSGTACSACKLKDL
jgi:hypothetical protein